MAKIHLTEGEINNMIKTCLKEYNNFFDADDIPSQSELNAELAVTIATLLGYLRHKNNGIGMSYEEQKFYNQEIQTLKNDIPWLRQLAAQNGLKFDINEILNEGIQTCRNMFEEELNLAINDMKQILSKLM